MWENAYYYLVSIDHIKSKMIPSHGFVYENVYVYHLYASKCAIQTWQVNWEKVKITQWMFIFFAYIITLRRFGMRMWSAYDDTLRALCVCVCVGNAMTQLFEPFHLWVCLGFCFRIFLPPFPHPPLPAPRHHRLDECRQRCQWEYFRASETTEY